MASVLKSTGRARAKVISADGKDDFAKSALFKLEWNALYPGMIEGMPCAAGGELVRVDSTTLRSGGATPIGRSPRI